MSNRVESDGQLIFCPSFNSYSQNNQLAEIASRVAVASEENPQDDAVPPNDHEQEEEDDFEFSLQLTDTDADISPHHDFNGHIFPVFNRDLLLRNKDHDNDDDGEEESQIAVPLSTLLKKEKILLHRGDDGNSSTTNNDSSNIIDSCSSSDEADELENIPSGTYCVWRPNKSCKKSQSAGSASKRWASLRNLMKRSNSEGMKDNFVLLTLKSSSKNNNKDDHHRKGKEQIVTTVKKRSSSSSSSSAHEQFYVRNKAVKEGDKKKSYLPYRKELVGFFVNGNGFLPHV